MTVAGRLWIEIDGMNFLGSGRIELLEKIEALGSLRKAAISMGVILSQSLLCHPLNE